MTKMDRQTKKQVVREWQTIFKGMSPHESMGLMRRVGPLLVGVYLQPNGANDAYYPTFHVHNLASRFDFLTLTLSHRLVTTRNSVQELIEMRKHEKVWPEAAQRLLAQINWPVEGDLTLGFVLARYDDRLAASYDWECLPLLEDRISLASWCGNVELSQKLLHDAVSRIGSWSPDDLESQLSHKNNCLDEWLTEYKKIALNPELPRLQVEKSIELLKVGKLPVSNLICE